MKILQVLAAKREDVDHFLSSLYGFLAAFENKGKTNIDPSVFSDEFAKKLGVITPMRAAIKALKAKKKTTVQEKLVDIAAKIKDKLPAVSKETTISDEQLKILKDFSIWARTQSPASANRLKNMVHHLGNENITGEFVVKTTSDKDKDNASALKKLVTIIRKAGYDPTKGDLTPVEKAEFREKNPTLYKEYLATKRGITDLSKTHHRDIVRSSGKPTLPVDEVREELKKRGITTIIPPGFDGHTDEAGNLYTHGGKKLKGRPTTPVKMNPKYNPKADNGYVLSTDSPGSPPVRYYTEDYRHAAKQDTMKAASNVTREIHGSLDQLEKDMRKRPIDKTALAAAITAMIYLTAARVGTHGNEYQGKPTFGISTLYSKHVKLAKDGGLDVSYPGKKGVQQTHHIAPHTLLAKTLIQLVKELRGSHDGDYYLYQTPKTWETISGEHVGRYLQNRLKIKATPKHIRTALGTQLAEDVLKDSKFTPENATQKEVEQWYLKAMEAVGKKLGHIVNRKDGPAVTSRTAIANYIDPQLQLNFFKHLGLRIPSFLKPLENVKD